MTTYALATGAGKDATLALHRARDAGLEVTRAVSIYEGSTSRVRFHGTRAELVAAHARALGMEPVLRSTHPADFAEVLTGVLGELREAGIGGVVFGNVHLDDVRAWYEERTTGAGLEHVEPLWGSSPETLVRELVDAGYRTTIVSVDEERGDPGWLGRDVDHTFVDEALARGIDPCGERGEYHTFVRDGPLFRNPVTVRPGRRVEMEGHRLLDLVPAGPDAR